MINSRQFWIFCFSVMALMGSCVAILATVQARDYELRGYVDATTTQELPFRIPRLGINAELTQYAEGELDKQLALMQQANIHWIRQFARWDEIEAIQGTYDWKQWDIVLEAISDYPSLELVVVFVNTPTWARANPELSVTAPPYLPDYFAKFASSFAKRYGDRISYYQIWDEPNLASGWGESLPSAADYSALLQTAFNAIHSVDPDAVIMSGALAPTTEAGPNNISDLLFLDQLYVLGLSDYSDAVAGKPYGFNSSPGDRRVSEDHLNFSRLIALREIMKKYGDSQSALWASDWGWNYLPPDWAGKPSIWGSVSEQEQNEFTLQALNRSEQEWPWLGGMILHQWQPESPSDDPQWGFAVIDAEDTPRSLWHTLSNYNGNKVAATNGLFAAQNPYARYYGIWVFSDFGADIGWVQDSRFEFDFEGNEIALLVRQDDYVAHFYPSIQGQKANALPTDSEGNAYLLLRSGSLSPEIRLVKVASHLPKQEQFTLSVVADELVPDEAQRRWPLIGYAVSDGDLSAPYNRQIRIAFVTAMIALLSTLACARELQWEPVISRTSFLWRSLYNLGQMILSGVTSIALMIAMYITWGDGPPTIFRREPVQLGLSLLTSGIIYINEPSIIVVLGAVILLFIIIYNRLELGVALTIFWVPFFLFPVELYKFAFPMGEVIFIITFLAWLLNLFVKREHMQLYRILKKPVSLDYLVLLWVILGFFSLSWTKHVSVAFTDLRTFILEPAILYFIIRTLQIRKSTLLLWVDTLVLAGTVVALIGLVMWLQGDSIITAESGARRLASVYGSPNNVGLFLGRCIPFAASMLFIKTDRRKVFALISLGLMFAAVVLSQSAGALFLGIPLSIIIIVILFLQKKARFPLIVFLITAIIGTFFALQNPRFSRLLDFNEGTNFYRIRVWQSSLNLIEDHPLTGIGLDQFLYEFRDTYILPDAWEEPNLSHPHNLILDHWIRMGILGVILLVVTQIAFWRQCLNTYHRQKYSISLQAAINIGLMGAMGNLIAHGLVDNSIYVFDLAFVYTLLLALGTYAKEVFVIESL